MNHQFLKLFLKNQQMDATGSGLLETTGKAKSKDLIFFGRPS
jgi:hypothetical protein